MVFFVSRQSASLFLARKRWFNVHRAGHSFLLAIYDLILFLKIYVKCFMICWTQISFQLELLKDFLLALPCLDHPDSSIIICILLLKAVFAELR